MAPIRMNGCLLRQSPSTKVVACHANKTLCGVQVPVDLIGIVTSTGPLGSVKRKSDSSEVPRRDVTLVDQR